MKKAFVLCFAMAVATASVAEAQATRTWVSGVGDDVNPCSRTAPCKTFAGAISKTAAGGEINVIDPGGFGAVTITKSITIDGYGALAGILTTLGSSGVIVNAAAGDVVILRNLSIEGAGTGANGIRILNAGQVHIENVTIQNFTSNGIIANTTGNVFITDTTIKQIDDQGIYIQNGRANLTRVTTQGNGVGVLVGGAAVTVKESVASGNEIGYAASYFLSSQLTLENSMTSHNTYGVLVGGGAGVRLSNMSIFNNTTAAMYNDGSGALVSWGNNRFAGNATDGAFTSTTTQK